jgi:quinol monooxygenase YgiN
MIHVIAMIEVAPGRHDDFLAHFHALMPKVHAEEGCLEYGPTRDVATTIPIQEPVRDNVVTIVEKWDTVAALEAHLASAHMQLYREAVKEIVVGLTLYVLEPA